MASISSLSKEYVKVQVDFLVSGALVDPTADTVQLAFLPLGTDPVTNDWVAGSWESDLSNPSRPIRYGRALVGPGSNKPLAKGAYMVWVKVGDNPETPVKTAGLLQVE